MYEIHVKRNGQTLAVIAAPPKVFKTGSRGYFGTGKVQDGTDRVQASLAFVVIGSRPGSPAAPKAPTKGKATR